MKPIIGWYAGLFIFWLSVMGKTKKEKVVDSQLDGVDMFAALILTTLSVIFVWGVFY